MSEQSPNYDPVAVILARMEAKLDAALTDLARHGHLIDDHARRLGDHANRIVATETRLAPIPGQIAELQARRTVTPAALASAIGLAVAVLGVLVTFLALYHV